MRPNLIFPAKCCCCLIPTSSTLTIYADHQHVSGQMSPFFREAAYEAPICKECKKEYEPSLFGFYLAGVLVVAGLITWLWGMNFAAPLILIATGLSLTVRCSVDYQKLRQPAKFDSEDRLVFENWEYQKEFEAANRAEMMAEKRDAI